MSRVLPAFLALTLLSCLPGPGGASQRVAHPASPFSTGEPVRAQGADRGSSPRAATQTSKSLGPIVAVLDTGVDLGHPQLRSRLWTNPREVAGNGRDDDRNGIVDDVHGADFVRMSGDPADERGHGTHVAGIVAAATSQGPAGSASPRVMALKITDGGATDLDAAARAVRYAVANGARVINASWGAFFAPAALRDALTAATESGVVVVAAAGNIGQNNDLRPIYPASFPLDGLVAVAATCDGEWLAAFSNYGKLSVDLAASGCAAVSTARGGGSEERTGTSMAAPFVAGAAASLFAARPKATGSAVVRALLGGARPKPGLGPRLVSGASLDVDGARAFLASPDTTPPGQFGALAPAAEFDSVRSASYYEKVTFSWTPSADPALAGYELLLDGQPVAAVDGGATSVAVRVAPGRHSWVVVARDRAGNRTQARS